jgi:hypothetical protein
VKESNEANGIYIFRDSGPLGSKGSPISDENVVTDGAFSGSAEHVAECLMER